MSQTPVAPQERRLKPGEQPPASLAGDAAKGGIAAGTPPPTPPAPLGAELDKAPAPVAPPYRGYAVVPLGRENLWELQELELRADGTFAVLRRTIPNTRDICTGRAISCLDGIDGFEYGQSA